MTREELFVKLNEIENLIEDLFKDNRKNYNSKKFKSLVNEYNKLVIDYNKSNNCYYNQDEWIYNIVGRYNETITGNKLTEKVANELNKLDGVVIEKTEETNTYYVYVITPYNTYVYILSRGYNNHANLLFNMKANSHILPVKDSIIELIYGSEIPTWRNFLNKETK